MTHRRRTRETTPLLSTSEFAGGLTLREHLELPSDGQPESITDDRSLDRVRAALRTWATDGDGALPSPLAGWTPESLIDQLSGRNVPADHPARTDWEWLVRAHCDPTEDPRRDEPSGVQRLDLTDHAPWQRQLLGLLHPAFGQVQREASESLCDATPLALEAAHHWLATPPPVLLRALTGAFVVDFQAVRRLQPDPEIDNWFTHHLHTLTGDGASTGDQLVAFFARYPLLARLLSSLLQGWRDAAIEFARRLEADRDRVAEFLGGSELDLVRVSPGQGDRHRGGRTVAKVEFRQGTLAYKPASATVLTCLRTALDRLAPGAIPEVNTPDVLDRDTHTWMTWLIPNPCADDEVADYYHRLGGLNSIAWLLGANDLHAENLVVRDARPWLVDVETLLSPAPEHRDAGHAHAAPGILLESPVSTGILPFSVDVGNDISVDMSAFADQPGQLGGEVTTWDAAGTSEMHAVRRRITQEATGSAVHTRNGPCDPFQYCEQVINGSAAGFARLRGLADALLTGLEEALTARRARVRVLLRNTALYVRVSDYLHHPAVLNNPFLAEAAFGLLDPDAVHADPKHAQAVLDAERAALLAGDVPYFETEATGRDLFGPDDLHLPDFFAESPMDRVRVRAEKAGTDTTALQWVSGASLRAADLNRRRTRPLRVCCDTPATSEPTDRDLVEAAQLVADRVTALAQRDSGDVSWLTLRVDTADNWRLAAVDDSLYFGTLGIGLFLEVLSALHPVPGPVTDLRNRLRDQHGRAAAERPADPPLGLFDGLAGRLHVEAVLDRLGAPTSGQLPALLESLDRTVPVDDLLVGAAGVVLSLCHLGEVRPDLADRAGAIAARHVASLLERARPQPQGCTWLFDGEEPNLGMAHGSSGIAAALRTFARTHPDSALSRPALTCATEALTHEEHHFDPTARNWPDLRVIENRTSDFSPSWCNGSAGIGMARLLSLRAPGPDIDRLQADLEHALDSTVREGLGMGQSLCHGDLGTSDLLLATGRETDRPDLVDRARRIGGMVATDLRRHDGVATLDFDARLDVPGLLNGSAGLGYQLLRLAHPDVVPSLLLAEVAP